MGSPDHCEWGYSSSTSSTWKPQLSSVVECELCNKTAASFTQLQKETPYPAEAQGPR